MDITTTRQWPGSLAGLLPLLYLLSGAISLAYEVLWTRMLSLQFGVSIFGVVITVAAFMAGLGLGSLLGAGLARRAARPLRLLASLEIVIAGLAVITPSLLLALETQLAGAAAGLGFAAWSALQLAVVLAVLLLPAIAMGAGFPLVLAAAERCGLGLGAVYGMNALGGALGALLPLWLLPVIGWLASLQVVAAGGLLLGGLLLLLSWRVDTAGVRAGTTEPAPRPDRNTLLLYAGIGAAALLLEIGWTRLFGMVLLRTEYVLAIILAVFLAGIGLGSLVARVLTRAFWFSLLPIIAASCAFASLWCLPWLASWAEAARPQSLAAALLQQGAMVALLTLPVTLVFGAWLPLLAQRYAHAHHSGVWLYAVNSLGAALGALLAGFVLIPVIGSNATIILGALLLLTCGLSWAHSPRAWFALMVLALLALPLREMPEVARLLPQAYAGARQLSLREDAISITHVVERTDGQRQLLEDLQRVEASSDATAVVVQMNQARLPLLLHPKPRRVLFLGLGTGISAAGSLPFPALERSAVELSQGAIEAARGEFRPVNGGITDQLQIVRDDARHFLLSDTGVYDVIIGDLFHPDLVGRSSLLSRQQFVRTRDHLARQGLFVQWLALNQFDLDSLHTVLRTFRAVFPDGVLFVDGFRLALVGGRDAGVSSAALLNNLARLDADAQEQATGGEGPWTWLSRYWGPIPETPGKLQDEWAPVIEYRLPSARYNGDLDLAAILDWLRTQRPRPALAAAALAIESYDRQLFEDAYAATDLSYQRWLAILRQQPGADPQYLPLAYQANPRDRWVGFALADGVLAQRDAAGRRGVDERALYESVLKIRPDHTEALRGLWRLARERGDARAADEYRERLRALSPLDAELKAWR